MRHDILHALVQPLLGQRSDQAIADIVIPDVPPARGDQVSGAEIALALAVALHARLLDAVPTGRAYVEDCRAAGRRILFDHGALRTIRLPGGLLTGGIPAGQNAFARLLEPMGYRFAQAYPLDALKMTGFVYCHKDHPESLPQYFVSELYVDRFSDDFAAAAHRVFGASRDPLSEYAKSALSSLADNGAIALHQAIALLPELVAAFGRHHDDPALADYEALKAESAEAAWIATEGNAFNHATDRVDDLAVLADAQRALGRPMKDRIEVSGSGRVRQTAYRADWIDRAFVSDDGKTIMRSVPGSFYEFIARDVDPATGRLDLRFDAANATGIFKMTALDA